MLVTTTNIQACLLSNSFTLNYCLDTLCHMLILSIFIIYVPVSAIEIVIFGHFYNIIDQFREIMTLSLYRLIQWFVVDLICSLIANFIIILILIINYRYSWHYRYFLLLGRPWSFLFIHLCLFSTVHFCNRLMICYWQKTFSMLSLLNILFLYRVI